MEKRAVARVNIEEMMEDNGFIMGTYGSTNPRNANLKHKSQIWGNTPQNTRKGVIAFNREFFTGLISGYF
jgi:hypothetical protein